MGESKADPAKGGLGLGREEVSCCKTPASCAEAAVEPCEEVSLSWGTVKGLSDFRDLLRQSCGCEGDWSAMDEQDVFACSGGAEGRALLLLGVMGL